MIVTIEKPKISRCMVCIFALNNKNMGGCLHCKSPLLPLTLTCFLSTGDFICNLILDIIGESEYRALRRTIDEVLRLALTLLKLVLIS